MRSYRHLFLYLLLSLFAGITCLKAEKEIPIEFERISPRVLLVKCGQVYTDQVIAIASKKGIVMIDTGKTPTLSVQYRKIIEQEFGRSDFIYVINTHYHFDHTNGNQVFADANIIAHERTPEMMKQFQKGLPQFTQSRIEMRQRFLDQIKNSPPGSETAKQGEDIAYHLGIMIEDLKKDFTVTLPTITFKDHMTLYLGDLTLRLIYFGEGRHTGDDILIHCPEEKLLFTGDLFYKGTMILAFQPNFDGERWIKALNYVFQDRNSVKTVFDTHNGRMPGEFIALFHEYLVDIWNGLKKAKEQGLDLEVVEARFPYEKFKYLEKSGLPEDQLRREHLDGLRNTWNALTVKQ